MDKSITTRKTKARYIFTLFKILDVDYSSQPKMCCKFCKWTVTKNATRMANHIINACKSCPPTVKKHAYLIQTTKDIKQPNFEPDNSVDIEDMAIDPEVNSPVSITNCNDNNENTEDDSESKFVLKNFVDNDNLDSDDQQQMHEHKHEPQNYSKPIKVVERTTSDSKYKWTVIEENNDTHDKIDKKIKKIKPNDVYKKESIAFGNLVTSEIDCIEDLEILNQLKHDISNILYVSKKQYLKQLKLKKK